MLKKILYWQKIEKALRRDRLTELLLDFLNGKLPAWEMYRGLRQLYMRYGDDRSTIPDGVGLGRVTGRDELYEEIRDTIRRTHPRKQDLRPDLVESYVHTTVSRTVTTERMHEYQKRGVQKVQVIAYIDHATTPICRSMNGRIFEIGTAAQSLKSQEPLVHKEDFWKGNKFFYQTPTKDMYKPWLPPYHFNCRTRIIPYVEPADPYERAMDRYHNIEQLEGWHVKAILDKAMGFEFAKGELYEHWEKHEAVLGLLSEEKYMGAIKDMLVSTLSNAGIAISKRNGCRTLYLWSPKVCIVEGEARYHFVVFNLDEMRIQTYHAKSKKRILENLDTKTHGKVMWLTRQTIWKGDKKMVVKYDVECYEAIIQDLATNDDNCEIWMMDRFGFEKEWDTIRPELQKFILEIDRKVVELYNGMYNDEMFREYMDTIRRRLEIEEGKR